MALQLFRTKSADQLIRESEDPDRQMKRTLSALDLTALGIGAIIGAGIFSLVGTASAGETYSSRIKTPLMNFIIGWLSGAEVRLGRPGAGPALVISLVVAAIACAFAALCYAELASMIPISGSAYTYSYATLGEIFAWIIGWDLILEYAVGNMAVAVSWSGYFVKLLYSLFGLKLPLWMVSDHATAVDMINNNSDALQYYSSTELPVIAGHHIALNLPALFIVLLLTVVLVYGIKESARANTIAVIVKTAILIFFVAFGAFYLNPTNWQPFNPNGFTGIMSGSAIIFFAFIGFDAVSTTAEETRNPQRDLPIGMIASLVICTIIYVLVAGIMTGLKKYTSFAGDGARWAVTKILLENPPRLPHAAHHNDLDRRHRRGRGHGYRHRLACRPDEHRDVVRVRAGMPGSDCAQAYSPRTSSSISRPLSPVTSDPRLALLPGPDAQPANRNVVSFRHLAGDRPGDLLPLRRAPQQAARRRG